MALCAAPRRTCNQVRYEDVTGGMEEKAETLKN